MGPFQGAILDATLFVCWGDGDLRAYQCQNCKTVNRLAPKCGKCQADVVEPTLIQISWWLHEHRSDKAARRCAIASSASPPGISSRGASANDCQCGPSATGSKYLCVQSVAIAERPRLAPGKAILAVKGWPRPRGWGALGGEVGARSWGRASSNKLFPASNK